MCLSIATTTLKPLRNSGEIYNSFLVIQKIYPGPTDSSHGNYPSLISSLSMNSYSSLTNDSLMNDSCCIISLFHTKTKKAIHE